MKFYEISNQWIVATQRAVCTNKICNNYLLNQEMNYQLIIWAGKNYHQIQTLDLNFIILYFVAIFSSNSL